MAEIKAKIGLTPKGAYSATATYDYLDYVTTADGTYTSKQASNTGHALTETDWWEHDFIAPKMRINSGVWEVSYDGGTTYTSTGISALGKDGITPQIRINTTSKNWETSVDSGTTWVDTGITAVQTTTTASVVQVTGQSTTDVMSQKAITDALNLKKSGAHIYTPFINTERWDVSAISYRDGTVTIVTDATHTNTLAVGDKISLVPKFSKTNGKFHSLNSIRPSISGIKHLCDRNQGLLPATVTSIADNVITISAYTYDVDTTLVPDEWVLQRVDSVTSSSILLPDDVKRKPFSVEILSYGTNVSKSELFFGGIELGYNNAANPIALYWGSFVLCVPLQWERYRIIDGYVLFNNLVYDSFSTITNYNGYHLYQHNVPVMYPYAQAINNIDSVYIPSSYYYYGQMVIIKLL